ncbi:hypothetical protein RJ640_024550 [Escallonia rubra]|uniref:Integrase catalytic domain-containing protein n=1 Tax=Escallonia rubra TaxID=112253 RepID=A0AA88SI17_9ASTE|nr:hypothetical protein RJ640_024550 [Escallonia rubra]
MHIAEKEKLSFIRGNSQPPTKEDDLYEKWYADNQKVKRWLLMSMSPEIMKRYIRLPTARDIWKALSKAFYDGSDELQVFVLNQKAFSAKQSGRTLSAYYGELTEIFGELDHRDKVIMESENDVESYRKSVQRQRVHIFLAGLDGEFEQVRAEILRKDHIPELEACHALIRRESIRRTKMVEELERTEAQPWTSSTAVVKTKTEDDVTGQHSALAAAAGNGGKALNMSTLVTNSAWIIDSGATDHMTFDSRQVSTLKQSSQKFVTTANGTSAPIVGEGHLPLTNNMNLDSVLVVPSLDYNLLSVSQITTALFCVVIFWPNFCVFKDICTRQTIGCGVRRGKLYYLDLVTKSSDKLCQALMVNDSEGEMRKSEIWLWHRRLGHASFGYLKKLFPSLFTKCDVSSFQCEVYELAKSHCVSFPLALNKSPDLFMIIYSDVWGPSKVNSLGGSRWFVTFIDDCTRMTWVQLMKSKSEVNVLFQQFCKMIHTQYNARIQVLRSENGGEYLSAELQQYLKAHGIIHQTTCSNTPQQNGVAERKYRHLLEVVCASLIEAHLPLSYWGEALISAAYLINRVPSRTIDYQTPSQALVEVIVAPVLPNLPPHVFGCVTFVHLHKHQRNKLSPRAMRCVFVGYAAHQKGYRCYHPPTHKMFITLDVVFHEDLMYFSTESELQGEHQKEIQILDYDDELAEKMWMYTSLKILKSLKMQSEFDIPHATNTPHQSLAEDAPEPHRKQLPQPLTRAANLNWPLQQFDVKNAFLHGELSKEVYMELPPGCMMPKTDSQKMCKLQKALYGLKQSLRAWFGRFTKLMRAFGYHQSNSDHTLFLKKKQGKITALIVYVDDMVVTGNDPEEREALQGHLSREFKMKDLGPLKYFLGIEVSRSNKGIFLSQRKYALDLLRETGMLACQPVDTSVEGLKLRIESNQVPVHKGRYQRLVGRLMYLAHTRPDLAYALSIVSQYMHNPGEQDMNAVLLILRYLKFAPGQGILFTKNEDHQSVDVYTDADWAGAVDDRRSTSGYFTFVGDNLVTWRSKKQNVVARSSAEAEFRGIALGVCEALWLRLLLQDLGWVSKQPIKLYCDNKAACDIAHNPVQHDRTKHVEIDRFFIKEKLGEKIVELPHIRSEDQLADILTKTVSSRVFSKFLSKLGMWDIYAPT